MMKLYVSSSLSTIKGRLSTDDRADEDFREFSSSDPSNRKLATNLVPELAARWRFRSDGNFPSCRDDELSTFLTDFEN